MKRYIKLNSVGCYLDYKTGYTFPMSINGDMDKDNCVFHLDDIDNEEWFQNLSKKDLKIIKSYKSL